MDKKKLIIRILAVILVAAAAAVAIVFALKSKDKNEKGKSGEVSSVTEADNTSTSSVASSSVADKATDDVATAEVATAEVATPTPTPTETPTPTPTETPTPEPTATPEPEPDPEPPVSDSSYPEVGYDSTAPIILSFNSHPYLITGTYFDPDNYLGYGDDYDPNPKISWSGYLDAYTPGSYDITVYITDGAGNTTSADMTVDYADSYPGGGGGGETPGYDFDDFIDTYKNDGTMVGIDVSRWQGDIDFNKVKAAGCEFVIMRMAVYVEDEIGLDKYFRTNLANAKAAGLKVGVYYYSEDYNAEQLKNNVAWLASQLGGESLDFPVVFDWEDWAGFENYGMSLKDINNLFNTWVDEWSKYGYDAMLYGSKNFLNIVWTDVYSKPVWVAHYVDQTNYTGNYCMWQKGSNGLIDGIDGFVDLDVYYK